MELSPEPDGGAVAQAAACGELRAVGRLPREVTAQPRFAVGEEVVHVALRIRPAASAGRRHGHHHTSVRVDDDPQPS